MAAPLITSENIFLSIETKLGKDAFILNSFEGEEGFSNLFEFRVELYAMHVKNTKNRDIDFDALLQKDATITVRYGDKKRYINGIITQFSQGPTVGVTDPKTYVQHERTYYYATIRPQYWLATLRENCKIFQNMSTHDIIKEVLGDHSITVKDNISSAGQAVREYCVQYNETDFNFVSRLMEAEGIFYYFDHSSSGHTMVLSDNSKPYEKNSDYSTIPCIQNIEKSSPYNPCLYNLHVSQELTSSTYTTQDYDFEKPTSPLKATSEGEGSKQEVYHYPGNYTVQGDGSKISDNRLTSLEFPFAYCRAESNIAPLNVGKTFQLTNCPRKAENKKDFVLYKITHKATLANSDNNAVFTQYKSKIVFFHKDQTYLTPIKTPKPKIHSTQTAIVTGKDGEEIWTDKYGRVLVKFHWDLSDTKNDETSCWIRVSQGWTGSGWGMLFTPRIGQEVVVTFLNGNPDYPLITGCVYNGDNLPPYLPDEPTKSTIFTNSSKGGEGFNELRFEDLKDSEQVFMHAQKDLDVEVFNGNRTCTIFNDGGEGGDDTLTLKKGNRTMTLNEGNETIQLDKGDRSVTLTEGNETIELTKGNQSVTLGGGNQTIDITGNVSQKVSGNYDLEVQGNFTLKVTGNIMIQSTGNTDIQATGNLTMQGAQVMEQGQAMVTVKSPMINIEADAALTFKGATVTGNASASLTMIGSASAVLQSSASAAVSAPAVLLGG